MNMQTQAKTTCTLTEVKAIIDISTQQGHGSTDFTNIKRIRCQYFHLIGMRIPVSPEKLPPQLSGHQFHACLLIGWGAQDWKHLQLSPEVSRPRCSFLLLRLRPTFATQPLCSDQYLTVFIWQLIFLCHCKTFLTSHPEYNQCSSLMLELLNEKTVFLYLNKSK